MGALLARGAAGALGIRRLRRRSRRADDAQLLMRVQQVAADLDIRRPIVTLMSANDSIPVTWGVVYPTVLLPASATRWGAECPGRLDAVLVHELGHVTRLDAVSHLVARLAVALLWFHPLAWVAARQARVEREKACDDLVLARGSAASRYADDLLTLVQSLAPPATAAAAGALAMARRSQFEGRLLAILDAGANRRGLSRASVAFGAGLLCLTIPLAAVRAVPRVPPTTEVPGAPAAASARPADNPVALDTGEHAFNRPPATQQTPAVAADMAKLGGDWTVVSIESSGQKIPDMYIQGGTRVMRGAEVTVTVAGQVQVQATMSIDPSKSPKTFDYLYTGGPNAGKTSPGIYDLTGDMLKTNFALPGLPRPTDFTTNAGDGRTLSVWKRKTQTEHAVPNFAGTWVPRDPERNRRLFAVGLIGIGSGGMTISQDARTLTITRVISDEMSREHAVTGFPATTVLNLDGSPSTLQGWSYARTIHARWDGDRLAVTTTSAELEWTDYYSLENGDLRVESVGRNDIVVFYKRVQEPSSIAGSWQLAFQNVPTLHFRLEIALDGTKVTATLTDPTGGEVALTGELAGDVLTLATQRDVGDAWSSYSGELKGNGTLAGAAIAFSYDVNGNEVSKKTDWTATRASAPR